MITRNSQEDKMSNLITNTVVGVPVVNELTNDGVVTALGLENIVFLGMTWGAWFKIGMGIALGLLIIERFLSILEKRRTLNDSNK